MAKENACIGNRGRRLLSRGFLAAMSAAAMIGLAPSLARGQSVGFSDGADALNPKLTGGKIGIAYAQYGDITLQGLVNAADFHILASNFGKVTTSGWEQGDFLYQGVINAQDFHLLAENFGAISEDVSIPAVDWAAIDSSTPANGFATTSVVPEPASLGLGILAGTLFMRRRWRNGQI